MLFAQPHDLLIAQHAHISVHRRQQHVLLTRTQAFACARDRRVREPCLAAAAKTGEELLRDLRARCGRLQIGLRRLWPEDGLGLAIDALHPGAAADADRGEIGRHRLRTVLARRPQRQARFFQIRIVGVRRDQRVFQRLGEPRPWREEHRRQRQ